MQFSSAIAEFAVTRKACYVTRNEDIPSFHFTSLLVMHCKN
jgi:hypothetical protein